MKCECVPYKSLRWHSPYDEDFDGSCYSWEDEDEWAEYSKRPDCPLLIACKNDFVDVAQLLFGHLKLPFVLCLDDLLDNDVPYGRVRSFLLHIARTLGVRNARRCMSANNWGLVCPVAHPWPMRKIGPEEAYWKRFLQLARIVGLRRGLW